MWVSLRAWFGLASAAVLVAIGVRTLWIGWRARFGLESPDEVVVPSRAFLTAVAGHGAQSVDDWPIAVLPENIAAMPAERPPGFKIHWAWVPAAIFSVVVGVARWGSLTTLVLVVGGLLLAAYAEWRARRRKRSGER